LGRELAIVLSINWAAHSSLIWVGAEEKGGVLFGPFRVFLMIFSDCTNLFPLLGYSREFVYADQTLGTVIL